MPWKTIMPQDHTKCDNAIREEFRDRKKAEAQVTRLKAALLEIRNCSLDKWVSSPQGRDYLAKIDRLLAE
jgi:hypothetical protein